VVGVLKLWNYEAEFLISGQSELVMRHDLNCIMVVVIKALFVTHEP
jgi:hypothetical protein